MPSTVLRAGDDRVAPLVCVHPVSGRVEEYSALAHAIAWPGTILGISAPDEAAPTFADLAVRYASELDLQKPVLLLGWSAGGVVAAEMSRAIVERGGQVQFLGILDGRAPVPEMRARPVDYDTLARGYVNHRCLTREIEPGALPAETSLAALLAALRALGADDGIVDEADLEKRLRIFMGLIRALFHHEQRAVPVKIHLFETAEAHPSHPRPPTLGWDDLAPSIEKLVVGGTHFTLMAPRYTQRLAELISGCLPSRREPAP